MKLNSYKIVDDAIEKAIDYGYRRAFKYNDNPTEEHVKEQIHSSIMSDLSELINFDNTDELNFNNKRPASRKKAKV